jgi:tetratricopeptide (TPR) repeat protein
VLELRDALEALGVQAAVVGPDHVHVVVPVEYRDVEGELDALVSIEGEHIVLHLLVPVLNASVDSALDDGLPQDLVGVQCLLDDESDELHIVATALASAPIADLVVQILTPAVGRALAALLDAGLIDVSDASEDDVVEDVMRRLSGVKEVDPRAAVELAIDGAERCRSLGNASLGSFLEIAAAEVLIGLGDIHRAADLAEPAWIQLESPTAWRDVVSVLAQLRARQGRLPEAVALMEEALSQQEEPFDAAVVQGDLGVLLAQAGQRVEASRLLGAAATDARLDDQHRRHFEEQLRVLRSAGGEAAVPTPSDDALDAADSKLNEIASLFLGGDRRSLETSRSRIEELVGDVAAVVDRLGPAQQVRLAMAHGMLAVLDGRSAVARQHLDRAVQISEASGDVELVRWVRNQSASLLDPTGTSPAAASTPVEHLAGLLNRALAELPIDMRRAQGTALQAIELVDQERHRYVTIADRAAWTQLAERVYEIGLAASLAVADHAEVIEILERARAQGAPSVEADSATAPPVDVGTVTMSTEELPTHLLDLLREALGDRPVAKPVVASVRRAGQPAGAVLRVDLDALAAGIARGPAWWWTCHIFGERIYWAVRSAAGDTWTGANVLPGGPSALEELARPFRSVASEDDLALHPLLGDEERRLDGLLSELARSILPEPVLRAVRAAIRSGEPIRLVWAAPRELANLPVALLPVDGAMLLDGAALVMAPPTSLAIASINTGASGETLNNRPVLLVLGSDADLGMLSDFVRSVSPDPLSVLGAARHKRSGVAGSLATPEAVVQALRTNLDAVAVYFGHVDEEGPSSQSAALSLTDGVDRATLDAAQMLTPERRGAPHVVLLAGCSSLSASHAGSGEWWGLATALLWQGSKHVVGSMWDLLPTQATQELVAELVHVLRSSADAADALRSEQLRHRGRWLQTGFPRPYEWAGWSIVSVCAPSR